MAKRKKKRFTKAAMKKVRGKGATGPPVCRLCGTAHWNREPHKYKDTGPAIVLDDIKSKA